METCKGKTKKVSLAVPVTFLILSLIFIRTGGVFFLVLAVIIFVLRSVQAPLDQKLEQLSRADESTNGQVGWGDGEFLESPGLLRTGEVPTRPGFTEMTGDAIDITDPTGFPQHDVFKF